jgi:hypothetical protein
MAKVMLTRIFPGPQFSKNGFLGYIYGIALRKNSSYEKITICLHCRLRHHLELLLFGIGE